MTHCLPHRRGNCLVPNHAARSRASTIGVFSAAKHRIARQFCYVERVKNHPLQVAGLSLYAWLIRDMGPATLAAARIVTMGAAGPLQICLQDCAPREKMQAWTASKVAARVLVADRSAAIGCLAKLAVSIANTV